MDFDNGIPIYSQITELIKRRIASGELSPGDKVPAVRELAIEMGVNPNTMQKALAALENEGLLHAERTSGRYVTSDTEVIEQLKRGMLNKEVNRFAEGIKALGCTLSDALESLNKILV
ncbi:MAG: GntR family transcriptional regulator [Oscillospiraceae bacterium]|nr:GntR family transcriptional regulator [Oscillospiraceae bacterium]